MVQRFEVLKHDLAVGRAPRIAFLSGLIWQLFHAHKVEQHVLRVLGTARKLELLRVVQPCEQIELGGEHQAMYELKSVKVVRVIRDFLHACLPVTQNPAHFVANFVTVFILVSLLQA